MKTILLTISLFAASSAHALMTPPDEISKPQGWGARPDHKFNEVAQPVAGPVRLRVRGVAANISVVGGPNQLLTVRATAADAGRVELRKESADSYEVLFDGAPSLKTGHIIATVPPRSA